MIDALACVEAERDADRCVHERIAVDDSVGRAAPRENRWTRRLPRRTDDVSELVVTEDPVRAAVNADSRNRAGERRRLVFELRVLDERAGHAIAAILVGA